MSVKVFGKLGDVVVKHNKKLIVAWIILLACLLPFSQQISEVMLYEESKIMPNDADSIVARDMIDGEFPQGLANASVIVVVRGADVTSAEYRDFALEIKHSVESSENVRYLGEITSAYTVYGDYLASYADGLSKGIYDAEAQVNQSASLVYGTAYAASQAWSGVNSSCNVVFGIPAMHASNWARTNISHPVAQRDAEAYAATGAALPYYFEAIGSDSPTQAMLSAYWMMFASSWNATAANATLSANPMTRAGAAVGGALPGLMSMVPDLGAAGMMAAAAGNFTAADFGNATLQSGLAYRMVCPMMETQAPAEYAPMVGAWCRAFFAGWNATFGNASLDGSPLQTRAQTAVNASVQAFLRAQGLSAGDETAALKIIASFDMGTWNDSSLVHGVAMGLLPGDVNRSFAEDAYALGPEPSQESMDALALETVLSGTLATYPSKLPAEVVGNFVSADNTTMIISITFTRDEAFEDADGSTPAYDDVDAVRELAVSVKGDNGWTFDTWVTGDTALGLDQARAQGDSAETIVTIFLLLGLTAGFFRSIVTPLVSVGTMAAALGMCQAVVYFFFYNTAGVHYAALSIMMVVLLGAGTDYSIFLLSRYKEERTLGLGRDMAVKRAIEWAGESVTTSGIAVIIAFMALTVASWDLLVTVGWVVTLGVALALLMALTLVPSVLMVVGNRIFWPSGRKWKDARQTLERETYFTRSARFSIRHAKAIVLAAVLISVPTTYLFATTTTSFDFIEVMPSSEGKLGMEALTDGFGAGKVMPTSVLLVFPDDLFAEGNFTARAADVERASATIRAMDGVVQVYSPTRPQGAAIDMGNMTALERGLSMRYVGESNRSALIEVVFRELPMSEASIGRISLVRSELESLGLGTEGIYIGGATAQMGDIKSTLNADFPLMGTLVIVGIYIVLTLVLSSLLIPLRAILTIALSISWTLAVCMFVFTYVLHQPMLWIIPLILFIILMGLGMDYDIFLITRIREEVVKGKSDEEAITVALERTGGIITACGIIMAGAFGSLMLSKMGMLQQMGFALMFAVLLDALVVRTYLVPSIMVLAKKWNWWAPGPLKRVRSRFEDGIEKGNR